MFVLKKNSSYVIGFDTDIIFLSCDISLIIFILCEIIFCTCTRRGKILFNFLPVYLNLIIRMPSSHFTSPARNFEVNNFVKVIKRTKWITIFLTSSRLSRLCYSPSSCLSTETSRYLINEGGASIKTLWERLRPNT